MLGRSVRFRRTLAAGWAAAVLVASLLPAGAAPPPPTGPFGLVGADKYVHATGYGLLAILTAWAERPRERREALAVLAVVTAFGALVELLQWPLATRSTDGWDALANAVGAGIGLLVWRLAGFLR